MAKKNVARLHAALKDIKKNGTVALYLLITIDRRSKQIPLKLYWPAEHYDFTSHQLLRRGNRDKEWTDYQLIINQELAKCSDIFVTFRLRDLPLSVDTFLEEYHQFNLKRDFILYFESKLKSRVKKKQIESQTHKNHRNTLDKVRAFHPKPLPFESVTVKWCRDFETWLRKEKKLKINTAWAHLKDINTYLNLAKEEDQIPLTNPFQNGFSAPTKAGDIEAISLAELEKLHAYLRSDQITDNQREVLRQFLFSCYTGLRISDLQAITQENVIGDFLVFKPVKGKRFEKIQRIPLTGRAKAFIRDQEGQLFGRFTDQYCNRALKKIQEGAGIQTFLTNHVGRHSFATLFLELGGSVEVLQQLMGHSKISTTMRYVHVRQQRMVDQMGNFEGLEF